MNYPEYAKIGDKKYKINTDFRVAIKCNEVATDKNIGKYERALAIIYILFGDDGLNDKENHEKLLELAKRYLACDIELEENCKEPDMDYIKDEGLIKSSFKYDYQYNPYDLKYLHWYEYYNDLCNLSNSELGNCCVLNRIRYIRNFDEKEIKDPKKREEIRKVKEMVSLKKDNKRQFTNQELDNINKFYEQLNNGKE